MATTLKAQMSKFAIALAMAVVASLFCAGNAFAAVYVDVKFPDPNSTDDTILVQDVQIDASGVQNTGFQPVNGMFWKGGAWNILSTGTAAGQYASWDSILTAAIQQYNEETFGTDDTSNYITKSQVNALATEQKLSLEATDGEYTKYYPNAADLNGTSETGAGYFFNKATNSDTTLTASLYDSVYTLLTADDSNNPNGVGPAFAWKYATAVTSTTAGAAAQTAAADVASSVAKAHPRLIMGCPIGSTTSFAMGKRYCTDITTITLS